MSENAPSQKIVKFDLGTYWQQKESLQYLYPKFPKNFIISHSKFHKNVLMSWLFLPKSFLPFGGATRATRHPKILKLTPTLSS